MKTKDIYKKIISSSAYKYLKTHTRLTLALGCALVFLLGFAIRGMFAPNVAYVNLQQIVAASTETVRFQQEYAQKRKEFDGWLKQAKKDIAAETRKAKRDEIAREYQEIAKKRETALVQDYNEQLSKLENKINRIMRRTARAHGCKVILNKSSVVLGGTDITAEVVKKIKKSEKK